MRQAIIIASVVFLSTIFSPAANAAPTSFSVSQVCGSTTYSTSLTLNTTGATPAYDFTYAVNGVAGAPSIQTFEYNGTAAFAAKVVAVCNAKDDLGIFVLDTPAPPTGQGIFGAIAAVIGYRNSVTPIILGPDGTMRYGSDDILSEIIRRDTIAMLSQNAKTLTAKASGDTFFIFFGSPNEIRYLKLEYYTTALGHTYLANNKDTTYLYKFSGCEMVQPFFINAFTPDLVLTIPIYESTKVVMKDRVTYPDGFGCKGSGVISYTKEQRFTYDATSQHYSIVSSKKIPEISGATVVNGVWTTATGNAIQPLGNYLGSITAKKVYLGYDNGTRFMFVPKGNNPSGAITVYSEDGTLVKSIIPFGSAGKRGMTMTSAVNDGISYVAVGQKGGGKIKVYNITNTGLQQRGSFTAGSGTSTVTVTFLKLYGSRYGLVTLIKINGRNVLKVWKYSTAKKAFVQDIMFDLRKLKISGSMISLK